MKKNKWFIALGSAALLISSLPHAFAADQAVKVGVYFTPMHFDFDGKELVPPEGQRSFLYENSTYVPLRFVSYALNKNVAWDADTYTVTVSEPKNAGERTTIEEYKANRLVSNSDRKPIDPSAIPLSSIDVYMSQVQYVFDGSKKKPSEENPGLLYNDTLYVPLRFLSESVGKEVGFDPKTYTVSALTKKAEPTATPKPSATPTATPTPAPSASPGAAPDGGGGGGGSTVKPTYDSIIQAAESRIANLETNANSKLTELLYKYIAAKTDEEKAKLKEEGHSVINSADQEFASIMSDLSSNLSANGYSTTVVDDYKMEYAKKKAEKEQGLRGSKS